MDIVLILKAVVIGIVEGLTEFLPVSSTGHMIIVGNLINFKAPAYPKAYVDMFEVVIQLGAILAVVVLYWGKIKETLLNFLPSDRVSAKESGLRFWIIVLIACIPAIIIGFPLKDKIEDKLFYPIPVAVALVVGAVWMIYAENKYRSNNRNITISNINARQALIIGAFQCLALWPGMSRSASTIIGAWIAGLSTVVGAEFSFFLAIPMMVGASGLSLIKHNVLSTCNSAQIIALIVGFVISFIVALVVIDGFIKFLKKRPMRVFAVYRIFVGVIILVLALTHKL
ncbi:UDP-diphosphatase [Clostridium carboxidivorans P7]|uniref:Undecaprenyl-diphosphatase n=1 Tax=Clostridium carboxidivorans P7 TaxID=536227 RepID=C6Q0G6_9CLOT|nr:undecaprenyl-diphosphate phosphatase [Clostridium carboxidivorans]AKN33510.1 UDP-diphosphatase [Clostridium carboxidivorans P7]EET85001.1 undecaprenol kinase [Clostridium carboxidivorans P7]EFG89107.1 undecaprenyl-diphosphatase UppP [Clostridium carboxidivorans P7]